jgi:hypothetical protein
VVSSDPFLCNILIEKTLHSQKYQILTICASGILSTLKYLFLVEVEVCEPTRSVNHLRWFQSLCRRMTLFIANCDEWATSENINNFSSAGEGEFIKNKFDKRIKEPVWLDIEIWDNEIS